MKPTDQVPQVCHFGLVESMMAFEEDIYDFTVSRFRLAIDTTQEERQCAHILSIESSYRHATRTL